MNYTRSLIILARKRPTFAAPIKGEDFEERAESGAFSALNSSKDSNHSKRSNYCQALHKKTHPAQFGEFHSKTTHRSRWILVTEKQNIFVLQFLVAILIGIQNILFDSISRDYALKL